MKPGTVEFFANELKREHWRNRSLDFSKLLPSWLQSMEVTEGSLDEIIGKLNAIREAQLAEFRKMIGISSPKNKLSKEKKRIILEEKLNCHYSLLSAKQANKRREAEFLFSLACSGD